MVSQKSPTNGTLYAPHWLTSVAIFLLGALSLVIPSGYSLGAVVLFIAGVGLLIMRALPQLTGQ
ncbi:O-antigen ligase family protein, partial [Halomonas sp. AOP42-D1-22]